MEENTTAETTTEVTEPKPVESVAEVKAVQSLHDALMEDIEAASTPREYRKAAGRALYAAQRPLSGRSGLTLEAKVARAQEARERAVLAVEALNHLIDALNAQDTEAPTEPAPEPEF